MLVILFLNHVYHTSHLDIISYPLVALCGMIVTLLDSSVSFFLFIDGVLSDFINLTQVQNFTVSAQDIFTFRRLSVFTVSFTGILQLLMQIMKRIVPSY